MARLLRPDEVDAVWPDVADGLKSPIEDHGGDLTPGYLWQECRAGRAFLVINVDGDELTGACVLRPETWGDGHRLRCLSMFASGDWFPATDDLIRSIMRDCGTDKLIFDGRHGWGRFLERRGVHAREIRTLFEVTV